MLYSQLTGCPIDTDISPLLDKIDCKLADLGHSLYGNAVFMLNNEISAAEIIDLLTYKRILSFKQVNPDYCSKFSNTQINGLYRML